MEGAWLGGAPSLPAGQNEDRSKPGVYEPWWGGRNRLGLGLGLVLGSQDLWPCRAGLGVSMDAYDIHSSLAGAGSHPAG